MRGDLWVSSQADVNADLWSFVQNRQQQKAYWDALFTGQAVSTLGTPGTAAGVNVTMTLLASGKALIQVPGVESGRISVFDTRGKRLLTSGIRDGRADVDLRPFGRVSYLVRVQVPGRAPVTRRIAAER